MANDITQVTITNADGTHSIVAVDSLPSNSVAAETVANLIASTGIQINGNVIIKR